MAILRIYSLTNLSYVLLYIDPKGSVNPAAYSLGEGATGENL